MPAFARYIGIDYSGAETSTSSLESLRAYIAIGASEPTELLPPQGPRRYWSRRSLAEWLAELLCEESPTLVGIDHAFSFPRRYFEKYGLGPSWPDFLDDFQRHWPTDEDQTYVDFVREGVCGSGAARAGNARWRRLTETRCAAKSVFHFDVPGQVAKSTHAGLPWLRFLRAQAAASTHFWPFDGWRVPEGTSAVVEVYPRLWSTAIARDGRSSDQHDAYSVAEALRRADANGRLQELLAPKLAEGERDTARIEGWILGVA